MYAGFEMIYPAKGDYVSNGDKEAVNGSCLHFCSLII
jgi:hypothetical protein